MRLVHSYFNILKTSHGIIDFGNTEKFKDNLTRVFSNLQTQDMRQKTYYVSQLWLNQKLFLVSKEEERNLHCFIFKVDQISSLTKINYLSFLSEKHIQRLLSVKENRVLCHLQCRRWLKGDQNKEYKHCVARSWPHFTQQRLLVFIWWAFIFPLTHSYLSHR